MIMKKVKINNEEFEITSKQASELKSLLWGYREKDKNLQIIEFKSLGAEQLVKIILDGLVFKLTMKTFQNYKEMILDIINQNRQVK